MTPERVATSRRISREQLAAQERALIRELQSEARVREDAYRKHLVTFGAVHVLSMNLWLFGIDAEEQA